eukprot:1140536-Pelagomonas_calceolata.AAC.2
MPRRHLQWCKEKRKVSAPTDKCASVDGWENHQRTIRHVGISGRMGEFLEHHQTCVHQRTDGGIIREPSDIWASVEGWGNHQRAIRHLGISGRMGASSENNQVHQCIKTKGSSEQHQKFTSAHMG